MSTGQSLEKLRERLLIERAKKEGITLPLDDEVEARAEAELRAEAQRAIADLQPITLEDLSNATEEFEQVEKRGGFYDMARELLAAGWEVHGCILLLATWNIVRFSKVASKFDIGGLRKALEELRGDFTALGGYSIQNVDLQAHGTRVEGIFDRLAKIKGVEFTGAPKLMHLELPKLFVPWDAYIRGGKEERFYADLPCVAARKWCLLQYEPSGRGYVHFLSDLQSRVRDLQYPEGAKTLAKNIDEMHYVWVTMPIRALEGREDQEKRAKAKADKRKQKAVRR